MPAAFKEAAIKLVAVCAATFDAYHPPVKQALPTAAPHEFHRATRSAPVRHVTAAHIIAARLQEPTESIQLPEHETEKNRIATPQARERFQNRRQAIIACNSRMDTPKLLRELQREKGRAVKLALQGAWDDGDEEQSEPSDILYEKFSVSSCDKQRQIPDKDGWLTVENKKNKRCTNSH